MRRTVLKAIAKAMAKGSRDHFGLASADAGMIYHGQMISHDIVPPTNENNHSRTVTPYLNLDSLYGETPSSIIKLAPEQAVFFDNTGRFKLSEHGITDLRRRCTIKGWEAIIPEPRNDENRIISQLHLFWQQVHNWLIDTGYAENALEAQKYTVMLFQLVTIEGFCRTFFTENVFTFFFGSGPSIDKKISKWRLHDHYRTIPDFFKNASFRFGHSAVRSQYTLNSAYPIKSINELLGKRERLTPQLRIDWSFFFDQGKAVNRPLRIDTDIIDILRNVPNLADKKSKDTIDVILFNLIASQSINPAEGGDFIDKLLTSGVPHINDTLNFCEINKLNDLVGATFDGINGLTIDNLTLWPYVLLEAEQQGGINLGPLGSFLNGRVLFSAINHSQFSVIKHDRYDFEQAMDMLNPDLSTQLMETMESISTINTDESADNEARPIMEALIYHLDN